MIARAKVRGLSNAYADGVERQEIWVAAAEASGLPIVIGERVPIALLIGRASYEAGLRATKANKYVWISPDLYQGSEKIRLVDALRDAGFSKNEEIELRIDGSRIEVARALC